MELIFRLAGDLVVMQNDRALHGRTAFDPDPRRRHLQGVLHRPRRHREPPPRAERGTTNRTDAAA